MTSMVLTQVYLEPQQKKALTAQARQSGRRVSELMREAVDAAMLASLRKTCACSTKARAAPRAT